MLQKILIQNFFNILLLLKYKRPRPFIHEAKAILKMEESSRVGGAFQGYHVYKETQDAIFGEVLVCERKPYNIEDCYAVRVLNIHCRKHFVCFIFIVAQAYKII